MTASTHTKGPFFHRFMIAFFSVLFGLLLYWLLGFIDQDLEQLEGPDYQQLEKQILDQGKVSNLEETQEERKNTQRRIQTLKNRQKNLRDRTDSLQRTMNQLLEIHRLNLEKDVKPTDKEQQALAESETQFLETQAEYDQVNKEITALTQKASTLEEKITRLESELKEGRKKVQEEYNERMKDHRFNVAIYRLSVLIPILLVAVVFFLQARNTSYAMMAYAFGIAVFIKVLTVLHDYFPREFFKYILIGIAIGIVFYILITLIRAMISPKKEWLLKQYREAYEKFLCPVCQFPIRRGPLRFLYWDKRSVKKLSSTPLNGIDQPEETYTCPSCGTQLFKECSHCHAVRHSLLPSCDKCGNQEEIM